MSQEELNAQAKNFAGAPLVMVRKTAEADALYNTSENHQKIAIAVASMGKRTRA